MDSLESIKKEKKQSAILCKKHWINSFIIRSLIGNGI